MSRGLLTGGNGVSGQSGQSVRDVINDNFEELYDVKTTADSTFNNIGAAKLANLSTMTYVFVRSDSPGWEGTLAGPDLSSYYYRNGTVGSPSTGDLENFFDSNGDGFSKTQSVIEQEVIDEIDTKANADAIGIAGSDTDMGTYTGSTIADTGTAKENIQELETAVETKASASAVGVSSAATDMGTYTGSTIADTGTAKENIQELETAVETKANASALGVTSSASNMGTYTGSTITSNQTAKQNMQQLETAVEAASGGGANKANASAIGILDTDTNMGVYTGNVLTDNQSTKGNIQEVADAVESLGAGTKANASAIGITDTASDMGVYTGSILTDGQTTKVNMQEVADSVEAALLTPLSKATSESTETNQTTPLSKTFTATGFQAYRISGCINISGNNITSTVYGKVWITNNGPTTGAVEYSAGINGSNGSIPSYGQAFNGSDASFVSGQTFSFGLALTNTSTINDKSHMAYEAMVYGIDPAAGITITVEVINGLNVTLYDQYISATAEPINWV